MSTSDQGPLDIELKPQYYTAAVLASLSPILFAAIFWLFGAGVHVGNFTVPYWLLTILAFLPYWLSGINFIQTEEFGGLTVFETPAKELEHGFAYAPPWLTELARFPRAVQQDQFPGEPEQISNLPDEEADRLGSKLLEPIRITTGGPERGDGADEFKDDLLNERLTLEPTIVIQWQVEMKGFFQFYTNVPGKGWKQKYRNVLQRMRDTGERELNNVMSDHSAAWAIKNKKMLTALVAEAITKAVESWGIIICEVDVLNLVPSKSVNEALNTIPEAKARAEATVISATAEKNRLTVVSEGEAQATINKAEAEGEGKRREAEKLNMEPSALIALEFAEKLGDKTILLGTGAFVEALSLGGKIMEGGKK
jgi:regulator of protease activity HflC (stomatin/prohibitin superfamily)